MKKYNCLNKQIFEKGDFRIQPTFDDYKYLIMKWRNEQLYHLRQETKLTKETQDEYFNNVVGNLFDKKHPDQILFSFFDKNICVGYGGLVHINWKDKYAEISFVMNTLLEQSFFNKYWTIYLNLIEELAFKELEFNKIFVYAFDLRPKLYEVLKDSNYLREARLKKHHWFKDDYVDVLIYSKFHNL